VHLDLFLVFRGRGGRGKSWQKSWADPAAVTLSGVRSCFASSLSPLFIYFFSTGFKLRAYTLSHAASPLFCDAFFWGRVSRAICLGWL
jgi:hypothetical protein